METWLPWVSGLLPLVLTIVYIANTRKCWALAEKAIAQPGSEVEVSLTNGSVKLAVKTQMPVSILGTNSDYAEQDVRPSLSPSRKVPEV